MSFYEESVKSYLCTHVRPLGRRWARRKVWERMAFPQRARRTRRTGRRKERKKAAKLAEEQTGEERGPVVIGLVREAAAFRNEIAEISPMIF